MMVMAVLLGLRTVFLKPMVVIMDLLVLDPLILLTPILGLYSRASLTVALVMNQTGTYADTRTVTNIVKMDKAKGIMDNGYTTSYEIPKKAI